MFDFNKCKVCTEKRCKLAFLQEKPKTKKQLKEQLENEILLKNLKKFRKKKITDYWIREKKFYNKMKDNEMKLIDYDRKPYMNDSDWRHDANWYICIVKLMELDKLYYDELDQLRNANIQDLI